MPLIKAPDKLPPLKLVLGAASFPVRKECVYCRSGYTLSFLKSDSVENRIHFKTSMYHKLDMSGQLHDKQFKMYRTAIRNRFFNSLPQRWTLSGTVFAS